MRIWRVSFTDCLLRPEVAAKIAVEMRTANGAARIVDEGNVFPMVDANFQKQASARVPTRHAGVRAPQ